MEEKKFKEKRAFRRFKIGIPLTFSGLTPQDEVTASTHDISVQGLGLLTNRIPTTNANLVIKLRPNNTEQICVRGWVVWLYVAEAGKCRVGIKLEGTKLRPIPLILKTIKAQRH